MNDDTRAKLEELRQDLELDLKLSTDRDQHIRATQRLSSINEVLAITS